MDGVRINHERYQLVVEESLPDSHALIRRRTGIPPDPGEPEEFIFRQVPERATREMLNVFSYEPIFPTPTPEPTNW